MRLWQKVFLITFLSVMVATHIVAFAQLNRNEVNSLVLTKEQAQMTSQFVIAEIDRNVQKYKTEKDYFLLTDQEMQDLIADSVFDFAKETDDINIIPLKVTNISTEVESQEYGVSQVKLEGDNGGKQFIKVTTTAFWEGRYYRVVVLSDVTDLFTQFGEDLSFIQWVGGTTAFFVAIISLIVILLLTHQLKILSIATKRIANGEYQERVLLTGHDEIAELSSHMNTMAARIEENISYIEQVAESRKTFIANMTHELKTPLTSILGFADILTIKGSITDEERREYASIIAMEAKRLRLLSSKLMELISLGETELVLHPIDIETLIMKVIKIFSPICEERQLLVCNKTIPSMVNADEELFTSLLINLLDNACKASSAGQHIDIMLTKQQGQVKMQVRDYGFGISSDQLVHVTEAFYMGDKARSRKAGGSGIGLSLCKAITEAHHGRFEIDSQVNCGTCVTLIFPASKGDDSL